MLLSAFISNLEVISNRYTTHDASDSARLMPRCGQAIFLCAELKQTVAENASPRHRGVIPAIGDRIPSGRDVITSHCGDMQNRKVVESRPMLLHNRVELYFDLSSSRWLSWRRSVSSKVISDTPPLCQLNVLGGTFP